MAVVFKQHSRVARVPSFNLSAFVTLTCVTWMFSDSSSTATTSPLATCWHQKCERGACPEKGLNASLACFSESSRTRFAAKTPLVAALACLALSRQQHFAAGSSLLFQIDQIIEGPQKIQGPRSAQANQSAQGIAMNPDVCVYSFHLHRPTLIPSSPSRAI